MKKTVLLRLFIYLLYEMNSGKLNQQMGNLIETCLNIYRYSLKTAEYFINRGRIVIKNLDFEAYGTISIGRNVRSRTDENTESSNPLPVTLDSPDNMYHYDSRIDRSYIFGFSFS